ncbi:putative CENPB DNA-binding domain-containing protein 1 [Palaemon carinicauda]|uniref:putative CENPB DNA-binding domain-containing protein 1 n=1 Tax=Palaemon carinicauda TaxID=392227 RepID=UPI0035B61ED6
MMIEVKRESIEKYESGVQVSELAHHYQRSLLTICTILKQKDAINSTKPLKSLAILSKLRSDVNDEMERLLLLWIKEQQLVGDSVTEAIICEKASAIYEDLKQREAGESGETSTPVETFKGSCGWFDNFKKQTSIHLFVKHEKVASSDVKASEEYVERCASLVAEEGYIA